MAAAEVHRRPRNEGDDDEPPYPASLPVEPDEGLVPPAISDDPEHDRVVDPEA